MGDKKTLTAKAVMMGDRVYAGIDEDEIDTVSWCMVIEFDDCQSLRDAIASGWVQFGYPATPAQSEVER